MDNLEYILPIETHFINHYTGYSNMPISTYQHRGYSELNKLFISSDYYKEFKNEIQKLDESILVSIEKESLFKEYEIDIKNLNK